MAALRPGDRENCLGLREYPPRGNCQTMMSRIVILFSGIRKKHLWSAVATAGYIPMRAVGLRDCNRDCRWLSLARESRESREWTRMEFKQRDYRTAIDSIAGRVRQVPMRRLRE